MVVNDKGPVAAAEETTPPSKDETPPPAKATPQREAGPGDFLRVFKYAAKWDFVAYVVGGLASIGAGATLPLMNVVFGSFIDGFVDIHNVSLDQFSKNINRLGLYMFLLFLGRFVLNTINKFAFRMIGIRLSSAVRLHYLQSLFEQSIHVLDSMPPGAAASTITSAANVLQLGISEKLGSAAEWTSTIVTSIVIAFVWSWEVTLVTCSVVVFLLLIIGIIMPFILKAYNASEKANTKASAIESEALASIRMVMASGAENRILERVRPHILDIRRHGRAVAPLLGLQLGGIFFGIYAVFGLSFWYGVKAYLAARVTSVGQIVVCLMCVMILVMSLERISSPMVAVGKAMVAAAQFFAVIDAPRPRHGTLRDPDVTAAEDIVFRDVTFAYPSRPHVKILDRLNLTVQAGKVTAIVGPSGSGKSTIVGLVERWYNLEQQQQQQQHLIATVTEKKDPKAGREDDADDADESAPKPPPIELGGAVETCGHSLDDIDLKWWRSQIGLVQQEPVLFNTTILQNVANGLMGSPWEHEPEDKKLELVKEACRQAFADEFIDRLPEGYNTIVGDGGTKLSGGQRQRLAIARSIVRKPKILILDEATSAIDVRGERIVQAALDRASEGRTTITIAHRLSTIKKADRIVVLKGGRVVEDGNHESLLKIEGGVYHGLVYAQQLTLGQGPQEDDDDEIKDDEDEKPAEGVVADQKSTADSEVGVAGPKNKKKKKKDGDENQQRSFFASFGSIVVEQKSQWPWYGCILVFAAGAGSNTAIMAYLFANLIGIFGLQGEELRSESRFWSLMYVMFAIGIGVSYFFLISASSLVAASVSTSYRIEYFGNILFQKPSYFDDQANSHGTLTSRVSGDPKRLEELLGVPMAFALQSMLGLVGALAIAFAFSWKLALLGFFVAMPINIAATYWRFRYELEFEKLNNDVFEESSQFASESIGAARTVAALTLEDPITSRYSDLLNGHVRAAFKKARWRSPVFAISDSIAIACQAFVLWYGGRLLLANDIGLVNFFVCFMAVTQGAEAAGQGFSFGPNAAQVTVASNRILNARGTRINTSSPSESEKVPDAHGGMKIELQDVHFGYPSRTSAPVFRGLNLTVEKGQFAALVGASGSGKTSIISLLERFYEPSAGRILCNGTDIAKVDVYAWRKHLSLVAQEASLLQGTIRENILLGVDAASVTEERIHQVCRDASIHDFIVSLPEGYNTSIGSRGVSLSGGQKQRLSIARALIRDPQVLLLDEATSSLDSESERLVQEAFERASNGRTMVVVAHRLATIQRADVIFVLGDGRLLEQGNHHELLQKRGVYWNMCQSQALDR